MLLSEIRSIYHKELSKYYPKEEIDSFFYQSIEHFLKLNRFVLVANPNHTLTKSEETPLFDTLARLKQEEPFQYILGTAHFMGLDLEVDRHTLIPRPETEELVQWIIDDHNNKHDHPIQLLDLGTGSGCISIALAKEFSNWGIQALDFSLDALDVAKRNGERNNVAISWIHKDMLNLDHDGSFDLIVSNPPYVRECEKEAIHNNVKLYEPASALFVPDTDALKFYKAIAGYAKNHLKKKGMLYLEVNQYLGPETRTVLKDYGFENIVLKKDIFGNERMIKCNIG